MSTMLIQSGTLDDIADAIRAKTGGVATMTPLEMPSEIASIVGGGGDITLLHSAGLTRSEIIDNPPTTYTFTDNYDTIYVIGSISDNDAQAGTKLTYNGIGTATEIDSKSGVYSTTDSINSKVVKIKNVLANESVEIARTGSDGLTGTWFIFSAVEQGGGYELTVTCDADFAGTTVTCTDGVTTLTKTCPSASPYEVEFELPNGGDWTISGVVSGQTVTTGVNIPTTAELIAYVHKTITIYSATEDTITYTDVFGDTRTEVFASGQSSKQITVDIEPSGSSITFTSGVAKDPSDLTAYYSKTVTIDSNTTSVEMYPVSKSKVFYWYGFYNESILNDVSDANGWTTAGVQFVAPTRNTNNLTMAQTPSGAHISGVASKNPISGTLKTIARATSGNGGQYGARSAKTVAGPDPYGSLDNASDTLVTVNITSAYGIIWSYATNANIMSALWYE